MTINQRKKGHDFERKIAKKLQEDLNLAKPVRRILSQYQEKNHPDLKLGTVSYTHLTLPTKA